MKRFLLIFALIFMVGWPTIDVHALAAAAPVRVVSAVPGPGVSSVSVDSTINVTFNTAVQSNVDILRTNLSDSTGVPVVATLILDGTQMEIIPKAPLKAATPYTLNIPKNAIKSASGAVLEADYKLMFITQVPQTGTDPTFTATEKHTYSILLDAEVTGPMTEMQKAQIVQKLSEIGIRASLVQVQEKAPGNTAVAVGTGGSSGSYSAFEVEMRTYGSDKYQAITIISNRTGCGTAEANSMVNNLPAVIFNGPSLSGANMLAYELKAIGAETQTYGVNGSGRVLLSEVQQESTASTEVDFMLISYGNDKTGVIRAITSTCGYSLSEANQLASSAPVILKSGISQADAAALKVLFEQAGATVQINPAGTP